MLEGLFLFHLTTVAMAIIVS